MAGSFGRVLAWADGAPGPRLVCSDRGSSNDRNPMSSQPRPTVLLVEDDDAVLDTFARMLRLEGYEVFTSARPDEGLQQAEQRVPDVIILDFRMPLLDGLGFLRRLRELPGHRDTPVAIVTGDYFLEDEITRELQALGATVLFKPLWLEQLVELARKLISQRTKQPKSA
jgi:two-component system, OmpR family, response regulator PrrA